MAFTTTIVTAASLSIAGLDLPNPTVQTDAQVVQIAGKKGGLSGRKGTAKRDFNNAARGTLKGTFNRKSGAPKPTLRPKGPIWKPPAI